MLSIRSALAACLGLSVALLVAGPARADGPGTGGMVCPPAVDYCVVDAHDPGSSGSTTANTVGQAQGSAPVCRIQYTGEIVSCYDSFFGWFNPTDSCYYKLHEPPPPPTDPAWAGHYPDGAIYDQVCSGIPGTGSGWAWLATPPPGAAGTVTAAQLAQDAIGQLYLLGPAIGMAPQPGSTGLVGVPVWLWTAVTPDTWGPTSKTVTVPGLSVTATAQADHIVWQMGDGQSVTCANPGTPYRQSLGAKASPTCGYRYAMSSAGQPGARYTVTATTTWTVTWVGGGQTGQVMVSRSSTAQVGIGELQVLVS